MSHRVEFSPSARADQRRLIAFLDSESPKAAVRAVEVLSAAFDLLAAFPRSGAPTSKGRVYVVRFGQAGYAIRYRIYGDVVLVSRILHTREDR